MLEQLALLALEDPGHGKVKLLRIVYLNMMLISLVNGFLQIQKSRLEFIFLGIFKMLILFLMKLYVWGRRCAHRTGGTGRCNPLDVGGKALHP